MRLGVYSDDVYRSDGETLYADRAFIQFVTRLAPRVGEVVLFGRLDPEPGRSEYPLPQAGVRFVALPYYPRTSSVAAVGRSLRGARVAFEAELDRLDAAWLFGPHPVAYTLYRVARRRRLPVAFGIRQDFPRYIASRLPNRGWLWTLPVAHALERLFRRLARRTPTVVVGDDLRQKYEGGSAPVLATGFSLVPESQIVPLEQALAREWSEPLRILSVGRLDQEKNPLLLPEILARLRGSGADWRLTVVGTGALARALSERAAELGVADALEQTGYVPSGDALWERYRAGDAFLHVSLTEGLPQVLFEAQAAGIPIVATDVGGVAAALGHGASGLLVPPADADAAAEALELLKSDEALRHRLVSAGLRSVREQTIERQLDRIAAFLARI